MEHYIMLPLKLRERKAWNGATGYQKALLITILLNACTDKTLQNFEDSNVEVNPGDLLITTNELRVLTSRKSGSQRRAVESALDYWVSKGFLKVSPFGIFSEPFITVLNYDKWHVAKDDIPEITPEPREEDEPGLLSRLWRWIAG